MTTAAAAAVVVVVVVVVTRCGWCFEPLVELKGLFCWCKCQIQWAPRQQCSTESPIKEQQRDLEDTVCVRVTQQVGVGEVWVGGGYALRPCSRPT
jgi:hypothetical protein